MDLIEGDEFRWAKARPEMVQKEAVDELLSGCSSADVNEISSFIQDKLSNMPADYPFRSLGELIVAVLGMVDRPTDSPQLAPFITLADGRRSAIPEDFKGDQLDVLDALIPLMSNQSVKARFAHLKWFLVRKDKAAGNIALESYLDAVTDLCDGKLLAKSGARNADFKVIELLNVAAAISVGLGRPHELHSRLCSISHEFLKKLSEREEKNNAPLKLAELSLAYGLISPDLLLEIVRNEASKVSPHGPNWPSMLNANLWLLAATLSKRTDQKELERECRLNAVSCYVGISQYYHRSGLAVFSAVAWLQTAIHTLHGISDAQDLRDKLKSELSSLQKLSADQLETVHSSIDIGEAIEEGKSTATGLSLSEAFKHLGVCGGVSPEKEELVKEASELAHRFPIQTLFPSVAVDVEGKIVHRDDPIAFSDSDLNYGQLESSIMTSERIRRGIVTNAYIKTALETLNKEHFFSEEDLHNIIAVSPTLPKSQCLVATRGFYRWISGDNISGLSILVPLLESILRHSLTQSGYDISKVDHAKGTQENKSLHALLSQHKEQLNSIFGQELVGDLERTFSARSGPRLRDSVAHGLYSDGAYFGEDAIYGCWLIWKLVVWPLVPLWEHHFAGCIGACD